MSALLLDVRDLRVTFETRHGMVRAVDRVNFTLEEGETLGLVGESGSGKSVTILALLGLVPFPPGRVDAEALLFDGRDLTRLTERERQRLRGRDISMIFQDPMTSLNPFLTVGRQLTEVLETHLGLRAKEAARRCARALGDVGIPDPESRLRSYPHELSGGMRQRVMIAMALLCEPKILLADEPTTALDVTIQAQILELLGELQKKHGTAIVLITHDLGVVAGMSHRLNVMYAGRIVETGDTEAVFRRPLHPYTRGLLRSVPRVDTDLTDELASIPGQPPDLAELPVGCAFAPRCDLVRERCRETAPPLAPVADHSTADADTTDEGATRRSACFFADELRDAPVREGVG